MTKKKEKVQAVAGVPSPGVTYHIVVTGEDGDALEAAFGAREVFVSSPDAIPPRQQDGDRFRFPECVNTLPDGTVLTAEQVESFWFDQRAAAIVDVIEGAPATVQFGQSADAPPQTPEGAANGGTSQPQ